jgi:phosphohistidine swiveling domain-containing protein
VNAVDVTSSQQIIPLDRAGEARCGGKARGLCRLRALGLPVPEGFVITGAAVGRPVDREAILAAYADLGEGAVAVRSSASWEDGAEDSAAAQLDTVLDVRGGEALLEAVTRCLASLDGERAAAYRAARGERARGDRDGNRGGASMAVLVQRMVHAEVSGVLFSQDPTPGADREQMLLEAIAGLGEALVSGQAASRQLHLSRSGSLCSVAEQNASPSGLSALTPLLLSQLRDQTLAAERAHGGPLDLEWSVNAEGALFWLQARPITTFELPDEHELDILPAEGVELWFTRANVGEMLPGAATPLTISVFRRAVDHAMHDFYRRAGAIARSDREEPMICVVQNHLFFNLRLLYQIVGRVIGATPEGLELGILGRELEQRPTVQRVGAPLRLLNFGRYATFVSRHRWAKRRLRRLVEELRLPDHGTAHERYRALDSALPRYDEITDRHMQISARSGALTSALRELFDRAGMARQRQFELLGTLMSGIEGIESAAIIRDLDAIAAAARAALGLLPAEQKPRTPEAFADWLLDARRAGRAGELFAAFLRQNGHRCVREAELRETEWGADPAELAQQLWATINAPERPAVAPPPPWERLVRQLCDEHEGLSRRAAIWLTRNAREAVKDRELTKSQLIYAGNRLRGAYRRLAAVMVDEGRLPDADLLFFFTHEELGSLLEAADLTSIVRRASHRRRLLPRQMSLRFADFCRGRPEPLQDIVPDGASDTFSGLAVSPGRVRGAVRVVDSKADARALQPGEIICARFTDVGWTPYYSTAAGIITEIGSALSHGAVVAREYGLPLVTSVEAATTLLNTGDRVELDGTTGKVTRLSSASPG